MRSRGPLAPDSLRRYLAEKFESYLRQGWLTISIRAGVATFAVTPSRIELPRLLFDLGEIPLPADAGRRIRHELHFDPSGQGRVAIRHEGVVIVDDLASLAAYGLEDSAWASGFTSATRNATSIAGDVRSSYSTSASASAERQSRHQCTGFAPW